MTEPWWKRLPSRLVEEDAALVSLRNGDVPIVRSHRWKREEGAPRLIVDLALGSRAISLEVRFPPHYPEGCPSVRPVPHLSLHSHQFVRSGVLCLELGPDNWHPCHTVADMIRSAWRLIASEIISEVEPIDVPSRHEADLADRIRGAKGVLVRPPGFDTLLARATTGCQFEWIFGPRNGLRFFPVTFPEGSPLSDLPPGVAREPGRLKGGFVLLKEGAPRVIPTDLEAFDAFVREHAESGSIPEPPALALLRSPDGPTRGYFRIKERVIELTDMPMHTEVGPRTPDRLRQRLSELTFALVGVGSVGSRVALSLRRAGAERFVLVDCDILEGPNVCRFPAGFADVGATKVELVQELLREIGAAEPKIVTHPVHLASATNPVLHADVIESIAAADVLIDATANPDVFGLMAMIASDHRRPLLWAEVFAGGLGGLVAWAQPGQSPCPRCVRAGFLASIRTWPAAPATQRGAPYATGEDEPVSATDADVSLVASVLAQRAFEAAQGQPSTPAAMLIGFRRGWVFDTPMHTILLPVREDDWSCPRCWRTESEPDPGLAARAEALFLREDAENPPSP